jgi:WS/DGAT/MGAT family acyltransferase
MALERLTREDARILALEAGTIRGHTCKVILANQPSGSVPPGPSSLGPVELLREQLEGRLALLPRLRQRLAPTPLGIAEPAWVDDERFDIRDHVVAAPGARPLDRSGLRGVVACLMSERLDPGRPLWRIDVVDALDDGGIALIMRVHHCMADGMTFMGMLSTVLLDPEPVVKGAPPARWRPEAPPGARTLLAHGVRDRLGAVASGAAGAARAVASPRAWREGGRTLAGVPATIRRELLDSSGRSALAAPVGAEREVAFASTTLADVKQIAASLPRKVTVNDVVLSTVAGGLRRWLEHKGEGLSGLRVKVPVSLHHHEERADALGNRDSFMFVDLPLAEPDPAERLLSINAETVDRKRHRDAETLDAFFHDLGHVSSSLERFAGRWAMSPRVFALNVSNVPGPKGPLFVMGGGLRELYSLAEVANRHALRASVVSAAGALSYGLCADPAVVDELHLVAEGIEDELRALLDRA